MYGFIVVTNKGGDKISFKRFSYDDGEWEIVDPLDCVMALVDNDFRFTLTNKFDVYIGDLRICSNRGDVSSWYHYKQRRDGSFYGNRQLMTKRDLKDNRVLSGNILCSSTKEAIHGFMYDVMSSYIHHYVKQNNLDYEDYYGAVMGGALRNLANEKVDITKDTLTKGFILKNGREFVDNAVEILRADFLDILQQIYDREIKVKEKEYVR